MLCKKHIDYEEPILWDLKTAKSGTIKTVRFNSYLVLINGKRYKICGTRNYYEDCVHILENVDTKEWKEVTGVTIRSWIGEKK